MDDSDLDLAGGLLDLGERFFPGRVCRLNLRAGFAEPWLYTLRELDYVTEAASMGRFARNFSDWPDIVIPRVYPDLVRPKVRVSGLRLDEIIPTLPVPERARLGHRLLEMSTTPCGGEC